jgi:hypothetical protein
MSKQKIKRPSAFPDLRSYITFQIRLGPNGCWEWPSCSPGEYARAQINGERVSLHRVSYEIFKGPIPEGLHVCHKCDNPPCLNPDHLFAGIHQMNMKDMGRKGRDGSTKLTQEKVVRIKNLFKTGKHTMVSLAKQFSVTRCTIRKVIRGESWIGVGPNVGTMAERVRTAGPAKLSEQQVKEIRELLAEEIGTTEISHRYGVSRRTIYAIREGQTWKD